MRHAALFARIDRAEATSWCNGLRDFARAAPDADVETVTLERGGCYAFANQQTNEPMFNRVLAFTESALPSLDEILDWYAAQGIPARFDLCPHAASSEVTNALTARGLVANPGEFYRRRLWASPGDITPPVVPSEIVIEELCEKYVPSWLAVDEAVWPGKRGDREAKLRAVLGAPRFRRFLAFIDDTAVALARLEVIDGVAVLNGAGTLVEYRLRGCQSALTSRRIRFAQGLGCDAITSLVHAGSQSEKNLRRSGLTNRADRDVWMPPDWKQHAFYA
jgi:hypothetical protein